MTEKTIIGRTLGKGMQLVLRKIAHKEPVWGQYKMEDYKSIQVLETHMTPIEGGNAVQMSWICECDGVTKVFAGWDIIVLLNNYTFEKEPIDIEDLVGNNSI